MLTLKHKLFVWTVSPVKSYRSTAHLVGPCGLPLTPSDNLLGEAGIGGVIWPKSQSPSASNSDEFCKHETLKQKFMYNLHFYVKKKKKPIIIYCNHNDIYKLKSKIADG